MLTLRVIFIFFGLIGATFAHDRIDPSADFFTLKTLHFRIHYSNTYEKFAHQFGKYLEEAFPVLSADLQWTPGGLIEVVIRPDRDVANAFASTFPQNMIIVFPSAHGTGWLAEDENWVRTIAYHELTHIIANDATSGIFRFFRAIFGSTAKVNHMQPGWMIEGLATYEETKNSSTGRGRSALMDMIVRETAKSGMLNSKDFFYGLSLDRLDDGAPVWPDGVTAYVFGYVMYERMASLRGPKTPGDLSIASSYRIPFFVEGNIQNHLSETSLSFWNGTVDQINEIAKDELSQIRKQEVTQSEKLTDVGRTSSGLAISADEMRAYFIRDSYDSGVGLTELNLKTKVTKNLTVSPIPMGTTLRVAGAGLVYSKIDQFEEFKQFSDIYFYDLESNSEIQLTSGLRAFDPDVSSDFAFKDNEILKGRVVYVKNNQDANQSLVTWDGKKETVLYQGKDFETIAQPAWGRGSAREWIAFVRKAVNQNAELLLIHSDLKAIKKITLEKTKRTYRVATPSFTPSGDLLFAASVGGIYNVYLIKFKDIEKGNKPQRISHFESGAYFPQQGIKGTYFAMVYGAQGNDVASFQSKIQSQPPVELKTLKERINSRNDRSESKDLNSTETRNEDYSVFPSFWPKYIRPYGQVVQDGFVLGANTIASDPLGRHYLGLQGSWDTRASFPLYLLEYAFEGLYPTLMLRNHQDNQYIQRLLSSNRDNTWDLIFSYPISDNHIEFGGTWTQTQFLAQTAGTGGLKVSYGYGSALRFPSSIDQAGHSASWWKITLGGYFVGDEQYSSFEGWLEKRIPVFWPRHFLKLRLSGSKSTNRNLVTFFNVAGTTGFIADSANFQIRGYPSGVILGRDIAVANLEYYLPLFDLFHGAGLIPLFYNRAKLRLFVDTGAGETVNGGFDNFSTWPVAVGAHLMQDITLLFKFPITLAMGVDWGLQSALGGQAQFVVGAFGKFPL